MGIMTRHTSGCPLPLVVDTESWVLIDGVWGMMILRTIVVHTSLFSKYNNSTFWENF